MTTRRVQQVLADLQAMLAAQRILPGDRLPCERDLARRLGCSRETLRKALAELEQAGEIWRHVGQGTFYGPRPRGHPIRERILVQGASPLQLMQARLTIEPSVAAEAAQLASRADVAYLTDLVRRGTGATTRTECEEIDAAFHRGIAEVTGNPILLGLLDYLAGVRRHAAWQREWERTYRRLGVTAFTEGHSQQHHAIVDAITRHAATEAAEAMRGHLMTIDDAMRAAGLPA
ncbi:FadR/GntR family transcriptional regulator [Epibacterium sp. Ofav1-8]|uniref:FadR/GntR family transcriptional regulator n=1 Tax=Epibacterium sp. Ofav1-8 TaxID=2917735 RepID=UPI001EF60BF0|nr:FCD domain-containing protein [Epibacterium sp. Ofav1-8]MCG7625882.1 FCD domain-containing protein [Epibacterium sp. Ofav1-8]